MSKTMQFQELCTGFKLRGLTNVFFYYFSGSYPLHMRNVQIVSEKSYLSFKQLRSVHTGLKIRSNAE